jgi:N-glycosylase/DNA lyase
VPRGKDMEIELDSVTVPFSLEHTLKCGQLFRWKKLGDWWYGVIADKVVKIRQVGGRLMFEGFPEEANQRFIENYLRLDDDLPFIFSEISRDKHVKRAIKLFYGLRLTRQEPWDCLVSYICATYKNIPAIKKMVGKISQRFGRKISFDGYDFFTFPKPKVLAQTNPNDLRSCGLGFRAERLLQTAKILDQRIFSLEALKNMDYGCAKRKLLSLPGVGSKVADCVLLFSLEKLEAFPVDVWMKRAATNFYANHFDPSFVNRVSSKSSITQKEYESINSFGREYFGKYAGYAQEYIFYLLRKQQKHFKKII